MSTRTVADWLATGCPGEQGAYDLSEMLQWAKANRWCKSDDPLLAGGDSPNLERYRGARADLAELDREQRVGNLVSVEELAPVLLQAAGLIRGAGEKLQRLFGPDAFAIFSEAVDAAEQLIESKLAGDET